jgi:hypothetical protein
MSAVVEMFGKVFGRLTVIGRAESENGRARWTCSCTCGGTAVVQGKRLRCGYTKSCGCLQAEQQAGVHMHNVTHGQSDSPTWRTWESMRTRCNNPKVRAYPQYGGRGIQVCERWMSFENFLRDMGERPVGHTLDRKDNNGNYEPGNCRWATPKEQARNRRNNRRFNGKTVAELSEETGVNYVTLRKRLIRADKARPVRLPLGQGSLFR